MTAHLTAKSTLLDLVETKKSRLVFSADVTSAKELLDLADALGPKIVCFKTHIDILEDFTPAVAEELKKLSKKHAFYIFEDRKFADIGSTVQKQYAEGIYKIRDWAHLVNAHPLPGPGLIEGLREKRGAETMGCLLIAQLSTQNNLITEDYTQKCVELALQYPDFVSGFISQKRLHPDFIHITPGVNLSVSGDDLGQKYRTPEEAIQRDGCDLIVVGRGILKSQDPLKTAEDYRTRSYASTSP